MASTGARSRRFRLNTRLSPSLCARSSRRCAIGSGSSTGKGRTAATSPTRPAVPSNTPTRRPGRRRLRRSSRGRNSRRWKQPPRPRGNRADEAKKARVPPSSRSSARGSASSSGSSATPTTRWPSSRIYWRVRLASKACSSRTHRLRPPCVNGWGRRRTLNATRRTDSTPPSSDGVTNAPGSSPRFVPPRRTAAFVSSPWRRPSRASARGAGFTPRLPGSVRRLRGSGGPRLRSKTISPTPRNGLDTRFSRFRDSGVRPRRVTRPQMRAARVHSRFAAETCRLNRTVTQPPRTRSTGWCLWRRKLIGSSRRTSNFATTSRHTRWSAEETPRRARTPAGSSHPRSIGWRSATGRCTTRASPRRSARSGRRRSGRRSSPPPPDGPRRPRRGHRSPSHARHSRGRRRTRLARTARVSCPRRTARGTPRNVKPPPRGSPPPTKLATRRLPRGKRRGSPSSSTSAPPSCKS